MNWEAIGVVAELVSAIAVVVRLLYLIVEVRQSRLAAESASVDLLAEGWNTINGHVIDDPEFSRIFIEGLANPDTLTAAQSDRIFMLFQSYLNHFTTVKKHYDAGHLPEDIWEYHAAGMSALANSPGGQFFTERAAITPAVREAIRSVENRKSEDYLSVLVNRRSDVWPKQTVESDS